MKKTRYFFLAMTICSITTVFAEKMNVCQAFQKLGEQSDDFSQWKGSAIPNQYGRFTSSLEIEGADLSYFSEPLGDRSFVADFGTFDSKNAAIEKFESLKKTILSCYSFMEFAETKGRFIDSMAYFVQTSQVAFRCYKACFQIINYGKTWNVKFVFPQTNTDNFTKVVHKPYTDYRRIEEAIDQYDFSKDVRWLLEQAKTDFAAVKGEKLDNLAMFDQFNVTFMPTGKKNCYLEDRGMGIVYYEIPLLQNVTMETLKGSAEVILKNLHRAFGPEYGFSPSSDGMSVSFVHSKRPYVTAATLYIEKVDDGYSMTLTLKATKSGTN